MPAVLLMLYYATKILAPKKKGFKPTTLVGKKKKTWQMNLSPNNTLYKKLTIASQIVSSSSQTFPANPPPIYTRTANYVSFSTLSHFPLLPSPQMDKDMNNDPGMNLRVG